MRTFFLRLLQGFILFLQKQYDKAAANMKLISQPYHSLSPINTVEETHYNDALYWALQHRKQEDIKNIALTGPYGSGKSSILKTFQLRYEHQFCFLNISLATFKDELKVLKQVTKKGDKNIRDDSKDMLRLIELSILQQIFYHEKDSKIPDSRFKKIRSFKKSHLIGISAGFILLVVCGFNIFASDQFYLFFRISEPQTQTIRQVALSLFLLGLLFLIYRSVRLLNSIKVSKFKFHDAEIEIDQSISKSILNNHLDEILYFFEVTNYDVVIIEDLDRFEQTEIFTKLRELNLLINNSKKIKREVAFIYAVRDDMFQDKDRTKFFDFIIPVIPVINSSNSNNKLLKVVRDNQYEIADDLIDDIGLFVDDMRLLYNITNEYHLYSELLDPKLDQNKLLSMIVYKNIFPNDFVKLGSRSGDLYNIFTNKNAHIVTLQQQLDSEIAELKKEIQRIGELHITDIKDLRRLYLLRYVDKLKYFGGFFHLDKQYSLDEAVEDKPFQLIIDKKMSYHTVLYQWGTNYATHNAILAIDLTQIEKTVDPNQSYSEKAADIDRDTNNRLDTLRKQLQEKERSKIAARQSKIKELIVAGIVKIELVDKKKSQLINVLMRAGHIDEDYLDYISIFYEGAITKDDRDFLLNVKSQSITDYDFPLQNIDKLVPKISQSDFEQIYILNYSLLDFLLNEPKYESQLVGMLQLLKQGGVKHLSFIDTFIAKAAHSDKLIAQLTKIWPEFWQVINSLSTYDENQKFTYLNLIISYADIVDIEKLSAISKFSDTLLRRQTLLSDVADSEKLKTVITTLRLVFNDLDLANAPQSLVDFIYDKNAYAINETMLRRLMMAKGIYEKESFDRSNYDAILESKAIPLIEYIRNNLSKYVADVYLALPENKHDPQESLLVLLNEEGLSDKERKQIIDKTTATISDLTNSSFSTVDAWLLEAIRVTPIWKNVIGYFENNDHIITDELATFLNHLPNAEELSKEIIPAAETDVTLTDALMKSDKITDAAFEHLVRSIPAISETPDFGEINEGHAKILIEHGLLHLSPETFASLKEKYESQHINLAEQNITDFVDAIDEYSLDADDLIALLRSRAFTDIQKQTILESVDESLILNRTSLLVVAGRLALGSNVFKLSKTLLMAVLTKTLDVSERVKLFNMNFTKFRNNDVTDFLEKMPTPYSDIAVKGRRPVLEHGQENGYFANNLLALGYISKYEEERKGIRISTFKK